jgi:hypothetical protein
MQTARISTQAISTAVRLFVVLALLFAQWAGVQHRIAHAGLLHEHAHAGASSAHIDDDRDTGHSCAAFDAATVGDSIHISPFVSPLITSAQVLALWAAFISWDAPLTAYFSSRAPPRA